MRYNVPVRHKDKALGLGLALGLVGFVAYARFRYRQYGARANRLAETLEAQLRDLEQARAERS